MKYSLQLIYLCVFLIFGSCNQSGNSKPTKEVPKAIYPVLPAELHQSLFNKVDYIDFIFHDYPFSMSQSEKQSIQTNISYIGREPVFDIPASCKPIARSFFQIEGEIILEADIYYSEACYFYVFVQDGKAKYANNMSQSGIGFYKNILAQAVNTAKGING